MNVLQVIAAVLLLVACLMIIVLVAMQEGGQGLDASMSGSSDSYLSTYGKKGAAEYKLAQWTKISAGVFFVLSVLVALAGIFFK